MQLIRLYVSTHSPNVSLRHPCLKFVSMIHNWGDLENNAGDFRRHGASTNFLTQADVGCESINAMPRMSAIPVNVRR